jgi:hypothetical protein
LVSSHIEQKRRANLLEVRVQVKKLRISAF